ncbi:hypothetical protein ACFQ60_31250 [Streptomyces zhihengii]
MGVFGLLGVAYGAGLLLNHSDVPKSTTVLGVDIGGGTRDEAVNKLDAAFGKRAAARSSSPWAARRPNSPPTRPGSRWTARPPSAGPRAATTTRCR